MSGKIHGLCTIVIPMRKKKTNTLSRLACLLLTVSLLWLLPACGSGSASPFPPAEETVRAAAEKLDRSGAPVPQPASGIVTARVRLAYTGQQAFTQQRPVLTGACAERRTLTLLGRSWQLPGSGALPEDVPPCVRWLPLRLGRLALPGCVQETTCWARETQEQTFTPETAAALARRSARLQLLQDYPDAVIESERDFASTTATAAVCRAVFVFCANIAEPRSAPAASG